MSFGGRMRISGTLGREKEDAAKAHKEKIREYVHLPHHLSVYTDGSLRPLHRVRRGW
jgi:hypothetical protein